jgi:hypothetical protein
MRQSKQWWSGSIVAALSLCAGLALAAGTANASTVPFTWSAETAYGDGSGTLNATDDGGGQYTVTSISGTFDSTTIDTLLAPGGYNSNDNLLFATFPQLDTSGISFELDGGTDVNIALADFFGPIGYCTTESSGVSDCIEIEAIYYFTYGNVNISDEFSASTPLPSALPLFATGLAGFGLFARRKRKQAAA